MPNIQYPWKAEDSQEWPGIWGDPRVVQPDQTRNGLGRSTIHVQTSLRRQDIKQVELRKGSASGPLLTTGYFNPAEKDIKFDYDTGYTLRDKDLFYVIDVTPDGRSRTLLFIEEIRVGLTLSAQLALLNLRGGAGGPEVFVQIMGQHGFTQADIDALDAPMDANTPPALDWSLNGAFNEWRYRSLINQGTLQDHQVEAQQAAAATVAAQVAQANQQQAQAAASLATAQAQQQQVVQAQQQQQELPVYYQPVYYQTTSAPAVDAAATSTEGLLDELPSWWPLAVIGALVAVFVLPKVLHD